MWWIQTTGYHLAGLIWLIAIAAVAVIAIVALSTAGAAASSARRTRQMMRDREVANGAGGTAATQAAAAQTAALQSPVPETTAPPPEDKVDPEPVDAPAGGYDSGLGDSMRILHERYARGEITRDEYLQAREDMMAMTH